MNGAMISSSITQKMKKDTKLMKRLTTGVMVQSILQSIKNIIEIFQIRTPYRYWKHSLVREPIMEYIMIITMSGQNPNRWIKH